MTVRLVTLATTFIAVPALAGDLVGPVASIRDGDTFAIGEAEIRLCGINAPERNEPGAAAATEALRTIVRGKAVRCVQVGGGTVCDGRSRPTSYDRIVAQCFVGDHEGHVVGLLPDLGPAASARRASVAGSRSPRADRR